MYKRKMMMMLMVILVAVSIGASKPPTVEMEGVIADLWMSIEISENAKHKSTFSQLHMVLVVETAEPDHPHKVDFVFDGEVLDGFKSARIKSRDGTSVIVDLGETVRVTAELIQREWTPDNPTFPFVVSVERR